MEKAFAYIRTSTTEQKKKSGPARQLGGIHRCAKKLGYSVVDIFTDDISGTVDCIHRPEFQAMLLRILKDGVKTILVEDLSRLARATNVQSNVINYLAAKGITLISSDRCADITKEYSGDPTQKAMIQMNAVFFEWEKDVIVARLQAGRRRTKKKGGRPPLYSKELKSHIRRLYGRGLSYNKIATRFNAEGIESKTESKEWTPQLVRVVALSGKKKKS